MTTPTDSTDRPYGEPAAPSYNSWQDAYDGAPAAETTILDSHPAEAKPSRRPSATTTRMAALLAAAALAGGGVTYALTQGSADSTTPVASSTGQLPGTGTQDGTGTVPQGPGGGFGGGPGGVDGEQRIVGTLTGVGDSSITVTTSSGEQTYQVSDATEIAKDGAQASLSDLSTGETVLVHLIPSSSGSTAASDLVVERIIAGTGGFGPGLAPGQGSDDGTTDQGTDDSSSTSFDV
jgi:hypothetical protein